jgi:hypothetical protein
MECLMATEECAIINLPDGRALSSHLKAVSTWDDNYTRAEAG